MRRTIFSLLLVLTTGFMLLCSPAVLARHKDKHVGEPIERILVMRHAEKPDSDRDNNLAFAGYTRASKLPGYITSQFGRPDYIFVAADSKHSSRCSQTGLPLSRATGVPLSSSFRDEDYENLAQALTSDQQFRGKLIVVIWHHAKLPELVQALGAKDGSHPSKWKSSVFNQIWELDYAGNHRPQVSIITEPF